MNNNLLRLNAELIKLRERYKEAEENNWTETEKWSEEFDNGYLTGKACAFSTAAKWLDEIIQKY